MEQNKGLGTLSSKIAVGKVVIDVIRMLIAFICLSILAIVFMNIIPGIGGYIIAAIPGLLSLLILTLLIFEIIFACNTRITVTEQGVRGKDGHNTFDFTYDQIKTVHYKKKRKELVIKIKLPENTPDPDKVRTEYSLDPLKNGQDLYEKISSFLPEPDKDSIKEMFKNDDEEF